MKAEAMQRSSGLGIPTSPLPHDRPFDVVTNTSHMGGSA